MRRAVTGVPNISSTHGQKTSMGSFGKHLGYDYAGDGRAVIAPETITITGLFSGGSGGNYIEARGKYTHRFLHLRRHSLLSRFMVKVGQVVNEGSVIGYSGNTGVVTGPHLHHDVRKNGTAWNSSFANYYDWEKIIAVKPPTTTPGMPPVGSQVVFTKGDTRTTFKAGTTIPAGTLKSDGSWYLVRGYDPKFPYRILINSRSAGGNGVAVALYYTNGVRIPGWTTI